MSAQHFARTLDVRTDGRGTFDITRDVQKIVAQSSLSTGLCNVFVHHTSASLIVCENADPTVRDDLERFAARLVPDGDPIFEHVAEGPDDMPAHVRSILTQASISLPVESGRCALGTWQGLYLWEHRHHAHTRRVTVSVVGS
jgi:secondary thiamine-phosphate synthase enzyme